MPVANLVYGNLSGDIAVLTTDFETKELNSGETFEFVGANKKYLIVNATADIYVAFTSNGSTPNAAVAPRVKVLSGTQFAFGIRSGVKITVLSA